MTENEIYCHINLNISKKTSYIIWNYCKVSVILDRKIYSNAIEEIISDTSKFEKHNEDPTWKREASLQRFLHKLRQKDFFNEIEYDKLYLVLLLLVSMVLLKCTNYPLLIHFLNFVQLFYLYVLLIIILPVSFVVFSHL